LLGFVAFVAVVLWGVISLTLYSNYFYLGL